MPFTAEEGLLNTKELSEIVGSYNYKGPFRDAVNVADFYGFHLVKPTKTSKSSGSSVPIYRTDAINFYNDSIAPSIPGPVFFVHSKNPRRKNGSLSFDIVGYPKPFAESIIIKTGHSILSDLGYSDITVDINALGNRHNWQNFLEAFGEYYRSQYENMGPCCRELLKGNRLDVVHCSRDECSQLFGRAPKPINFLSNTQMSHLREIIEHLETLGLQYRINHRMIHALDDGTRLLFKLHGTKGRSKERIEVGFGERYIIPRKNKINEEASENVAGVHLTLNLKGGKGESYLNKKESNKPVVYFMHIGEEAKRKSMNVLESLRGLNALVKQSIYLDTLADQMENAKKHNVKISLIMGVKEVRENSIIVRSVRSASQETIGLSRLKGYLKRLLSKMRR
jgi:histidyl-tRNA synthetase